MSSEISENVNAGAVDYEPAVLVSTQLVLELPISIVNDKFIKNLSNNLVNVFGLKIFSIDAKWSNQKETYKGIVELTPSYTDESTGITYDKGEVCADGDGIYKTGTSKQLVAIRMCSILNKDYTKQFMHMNIIEYLLKLFGAIYTIRPSIFYGKSGKRLSLLYMKDIKFYRSMYMDYMIEKEWIKSS